MGEEREREALDIFLILFLSPENYLTYSFCRLGRMNTSNLSVLFSVPPWFLLHSQPSLFLVCWRITMDRLKSIRKTIKKRRGLKAPPSRACGTN